MALSESQRAELTKTIPQRLRDEGINLRVKATGSSRRLISMTIEEVRGLLAESDDIWTEAQLIYQSVLSTETAWLPDAVRNSWVSASGSYFQSDVRDTINNELSAEGIKAVYLAGLREHPELRSFLMLPARRRCVQKAFDAWPDNDIMLLTKGSSPATGLRIAVFGILSCKTSFRERATEACFWALAGRDTGIRFGLVTLDRDIELRTCENPTKPRKLLEAYFDRVFTGNPRTSLCGQIRPLSEIADEIRRWRGDVVPDFISEPW